MSLPQQVAVRYAEDDAGYVTVRPVVNQSFGLNELADMVVSVAGKDATRVQQIFRTGAVLYNGYHYWWNPLAADLGEIEALIAPFPEDEPGRSFDPQKVTVILLESGGGTQRGQVEITREEAEQKKLFARMSAWQVLRSYAKKNVPHYEKYSHARHADLYRVALPGEEAQQLLTGIQEAASRTLRHRWSTLRRPSALTFVCPR